MTKKISALSLLLVMFFLTFPVYMFAETESFRDVPSNHWARSSILTMAQHGFIGGYPDGTFRPSGTITKAEFTSIVVRVLGIQGENHSFTDVPETHWANGAIQAAEEAGILVPSEFNHKLKPNEPITRLDMAKMLARALALQDEYKDTLDAFANLYNGDLPFVDYRDFKQKNVPYLALSFGTRIMGGYPDVSFGQEKNATRAEAAVMLQSFMKAKEQSPTDFQYINEMKEIATIGMNAEAVSILEPLIDLTDPEAAVIKHKAFSAKLKRAYVIPLVGDTVSMYEQKYLWDRNEIPERQKKGTRNKPIDGYIVGVADVTFKESGSRWVYMQRSLGLSPSTALFYYEPEKRFGIESEVMEGNPSYEAGKTYEITFYAYYNADEIRQFFKANGAEPGTEVHAIVGRQK